MGRKSKDENEKTRKELIGPPGILCISIGQTQTVVKL